MKFRNWCGPVLIAGVLIWPLSAYPSEADQNQTEQSESQGEVRTADLFSYIWSKDPEKTRVALQGADKNQLAHLRCRMGLTILHHAAAMGNIPVFALVAAKWDEKKLDLDVMAGTAGVTPAHSALTFPHEGTPEILRELKRLGAATNLQRGVDGPTPLELAESRLALFRNQLAKVQESPIEDIQLEKNLKAHIHTLEESVAVLSLSDLPESDRESKEEV